MKPKVETEEKVDGDEKGTCILYSYQGDEG